jgi:hypothetical protein
VHLHLVLVHYILFGQALGAMEVFHVEAIVFMEDKFFHWKMFYRALSTRSIMFAKKPSKTCCFLRDLVAQKLHMQWKEYL